MSNVKFYKNKARGVEEKVEKYTPQYELMGIELENYNSRQLPPNTKVVNDPIPSRHNLQSYALRRNSPIGTGPVPNIGNNMDHTWSSVDGEIIDDVADEQVDNRSKFIDNNDYYTPQALGNSEVEIKDEKNETLQLISAINDLDTSSYLLLVRGTPLCSGPKSEIEEQVSALLFGEHELCLNESISQDEIVVLKKLDIKAGVFLGD